MQLDAALASSTNPAPAEGEAASGSSAAALQPFVFGLFFIFGGVTSLNDVVIPKLKALFTLGYGEAMLVQSAFFAAYFLVSLPASILVHRIGYLRGAVVGLLAMTAGCLLFIPAAKVGLFPAFLSALFVLAAGVTLVQVVANPLISLLGAPRTTHSRLTFAQAFNSLGTTLFPFVGAQLILGSLGHVDASRLSGGALTAYRAAEGSTVARAYLGLAVVLALVAAAVWSQRGRLRETRAVEGFRPLQIFGVLKNRRLAWGALCIFLYVGAEVSIGSLIVGFLMQKSALGLDQAAAGRHVSFYWGGAMVGRFVGAGVLRLVDPARVLAAVCVGALLLLGAAAGTHGAVSGFALLAIGLCNAVMFPTLFSLACQGLGERAADGSGVLCMAIVGGAVVPLLTGRLADAADLRTALIVPGLCYATIMLFGVATRARPSASLALPLSAGER